MTSEQGQEPGPGDRLRRAREAMGRSPEDISAELRLGLDQVRSLEEEAFHRLPGEAYIRGYLRNYAAAVGISPEEVLGAYEYLCEHPESSEGEDQSPLVPAPERPLIEHPWRVVSVSLVLLVVVTLGALWLLNEGPAPSPSEETPPSEGSAGSGGTAPTASSTGGGQRPLGSGQGGGTSEASGGGKKDSGQRPQQAGASESPPEKPEAPSGAGAQAGDTEGADRSRKTEAEEASRPESSALTGPGLEEPSLPELPGSGTASQQSQAGDLETLRVHTWADSWLKVADDRGRLLLQRLVEGGRDVRLYGRAPFQVRVGNAGGVQLYFEGSPLAPLGEAGEVVSLTVDAASQTIPESEVAAPEDADSGPGSAQAEPADSEGAVPTGEGSGGGAPERGRP